MSDTEDLKPVESVKKLDLSLPVGVRPQDYNQVVQMAQWVAKGREMVPAHLRDNPPMCVGVVMDAMEWGLNPFRLATQHFVVNGVGGYQAQALVAALNRKAPIKGRLVPRYEGSGPDLKCFLAPESLDGQVLPYESPCLKDITPKNSPLWKNDPQQQIFYFSSRAWARRYCPELLMGAYDFEEAREMRNVTPREGTVNFLNDENAEPLDGEVMPPKPTERQATAAEPAQDQSPPDGDAVPVETQAANMIRYMEREQSLTVLETWWLDHGKETNDWPKELREEVRAMFNLRTDQLSFGL